MVRIHSFTFLALYSFDLLQVPHVIDLDKDGKINPHIDSIKFSGDLVAGYSLGSTRVMRLSHETNANDNPIDIILPPSMIHP